MRNSETQTKTFVNERSKIRNRVADSTCVEPSFYKKEDIELLKLFVNSDVDGVKKAGLKFSDETEHWYTLHKPVNIKPVAPESRVRSSEKFGFFRMDLMQTHIRPNIKNVVSCHRPYQGCRVAHGQLGYLTNPYWACYGIYQEENGCSVCEAYTGLETLDKTMSLVAKTMPNIIASVNVMFGMDSHGRPAAFLSRIYSPNLAFFPAQRLVEYFANQGYSIVVSREYAKNYGLKLIEPVRVTCGLFDPFVTAEAYDSNLGNKATNYPAYRHPDIAQPRLTRSGKVFEVHDGYTVEIPKAEYCQAKYSCVNTAPISQADLKDNIEAIAQKVSSTHYSVACPATYAVLELHYSRMWQPNKDRIWYAEGLDARSVGKPSTIKYSERRWPEDIAKDIPPKVNKDNVKKSEVVALMGEFLDEYHTLDPAPQARVPRLYTYNVSRIAVEDFVGINHNDMELINNEPNDVVIE